MLDLVINEPKPEDIPSKLRPLMKAFQSAPFHVAPEREKELLVLRDKYDIRIYLKGDAENWLFEERRMLKKIFIGLRRSNDFGRTVTVTTRSFQSCKKPMAMAKRSLTSQNFALDSNYLSGRARRNSAILKAGGRIRCQIHPTLNNRSTCVPRTTFSL